MLGGEILTQEKSAKLLGLTFDDNQKWQSQISGKGGMLSSLNQRLFMIKRLRNVLNYKGLRKVAESLYISKVRYGLQLMGEIRWSNSESESVALGRIQKSQNKLLRFLNKSSLIDKVSVESMLEKHNMCYQFHVPRNSCST